MTIDELWKLCGAASPGPWTRGSLESYHRATGIAFRRVYRKPDSDVIDEASKFGPPWNTERGKRGADAMERQGHVEVQGENCDDDAAFIAAARTAMSALLDFVDAIRRDLGGLTIERDVRASLKALDERMGE